MAALGSLPNELCALIVSFIESPQDLRALLFTSRALSEAALGPLYAHFHHQLYTNPARLHLFLRNIINRPSLATHIKSISVQGRESSDGYTNLAEWETWAVDHYRPELSQQDRDLFLNALSQATIARFDHVIANVPLLEEAQLALLLYLARNTTSLTLVLEQTSISNKDRMLLILLRDLFVERQALPHLHTFECSYYRFDGHHDESGFLLSPISSFFRLPSLRVVRGAACVEADNMAFIGFDCPEGSSSVEEINFHRCALCPKASSTMIKACSNLRSFTCDWGGFTIGWAELNWPYLVQALHSQSHSLEHLCLDTRKHRDLWPESEEGLVAPLGPLTAMEKLIYISAPSSALIGWDESRAQGYDKLHQVLPRNIQSLVLTEWAWDIHEQLCLLAHMCTALFPDLRFVALAKTNRTSDELGEEIRRHFEIHGNGVVFALEDYGELDHLS